MLTCGISIANALEISVLHPTSTLSSTIGHMEFRVVHHSATLNTKSCHNAKFPLSHSVLARRGWAKQRTWVQICFDAGCWLLFAVVIFKCMFRMLFPFKFHCSFPIKFQLKMPWNIIHCGYVLVRDKPLPIPKIICSLTHICVVPP